MANKNLTKLLIEKAEPEAKDYVIWDAELKAFGARIMKSGRKVYIVRYRTLAGTQRTQVVARCSDVLPEDARKMAREIFAQAAKGHDPLAEKKTTRALPTVAELAEQYMTEHAHLRKRASSAANDEGYWRLHILPLIGAKKVNEVTTADVMKIHNALAAKPSTANQVRALLSKAFNLAETWNYRPKHSNPVQDVARFEENEREVFLNLAQIEALQTALDELTAHDAILPQMAALVRLLLLTGCRRSEIMKAKREWVDFDRQVLALPKPASKTGKRDVTLPQEAIDIIKSLPAGEWLIPGKMAGQPLSFPYTAWNKIRIAAGLPADVRLHDLRHTVGSLAHSNGASQRTVAQILGHRSMQHTGRYIHSTDARAAIESLASLTSRKPDYKNLSTT